MLTFRGWRAVGKALRAARTLHGDQLVCNRRDLDEKTTWAEWTVGDVRVRVITSRTEPVADFKVIALPTVAVIQTHNPQPVLDLLAGLGLVPASLSSGFAVGAAIGRGDLALEVAELFSEWQAVGE